MELENIVCAFVNIKSKELHIKFKDVYLLNYPDEVNALITDDEWDDYYDGKITDSGIYQLKIQRI